MLVTTPTINSGYSSQSVNKVSEVDSGLHHVERDGAKRVQLNEDKSTSQQQPQNRFDVDEASLALAVKANESAFDSSAKQGTLGYDQPSNINATAVSTYKSVDNLAQREAVQEAFGVDFYV